MLIVDAQAHIWTGGTASAHHTIGRPAPFTANDLLAEMNAAGVDAALLAPPSWDPGGNKPSLDAAHAMPNRFAVTGDIDWSAPPDPKRIRNWLNQPGMYGLRLSFNTPKKLPLLSGTDLDWLWKEAERADVPIMLLVPGAVPAVGILAERFPALRLCIDHLGIPRGAKDAAAFEHLPDLLALAKHPTITVKAGALPVYSTVDPFPHPSLHPPFRRVYDAFGPARIFWASDITRVSCSYREVVTFVTEGVPWLSQADKTLIMGGAVCDWLGWTPRREGQPLAAAR